MRIVSLIFVSCCIFLSACAGSRPATDDFVAIEDHRSTDDPSAPSIMWVPRSSLVNGPPLVKKIVERGYEQLTQESQKPRQRAGAEARLQQPAGNAPSAKQRVVLMEIGRNGLAQPVYENLRRAACGVVLDPVQGAFPDQPAGVQGPAEKESIARRLQHHYGATVAVFIAAPDGVLPGKKAVIELYDTMAGGLLSSFDAVIPPLAADLVVRTGEVAAAFKPVTDQIGKLVALLPWYGRITEVEGDRAYLSAGKESGLVLGQVMTVYRGGRFMKGAGFAPGETVGTLVVNGFVGPNASFGTIRDGHGVRAGDVVSAP